MRSTTGSSIYIWFFFSNKALLGVFNVQFLWLALYDSICYFYTVFNLTRPKIWTGPIPRPVSVLEIERDWYRDGSQFWTLNRTNTETGFGSGHWMGPIPRPGIGPKKICDLTETIPLPRVSLGTDPKLILFPTSWLPVAVYVGAEGGGGVTKSSPFCNFWGMMCHGKTGNTMA
jgi:hypothetical protein